MLNIKIQQFLINLKLKLQRSMESKKPPERIILDSYIKEERGEN